MTREFLVDIFQAALASVDPANAVRKALRLEGGALSIAEERYEPGRFKRIILVGAGKAASRMAGPVEELLGDALTKGCIIVPRGLTAPLRRVVQVEASHPLPDDEGVRGAQAILKLAAEADEQTLVLCLLSGGGSSLMVLPPPGITLEAKQKVTALLLKAGASIAEMNAVRKHLSLLKGGRLARAAYPASVVTLILSDVIGNVPDVIASGPTVPDSTTFDDAWEVIERYRLAAALPEAVTRFLKRGREGLEEETAKAGEPCFKRTQAAIIGGIEIALAAAKSRLEASGWASEILTPALQGEARETAGRLARAALTAGKKLKPGERRCLLSGGETTVTVRGPGRGGRNQELALAFALEIEGVPGIALLSAGTDGVDGPTDAAGAFVDGWTAAKARQAGIDPLTCLDQNDSYAFFHRLDLVTGGKSHFLTGPTGTNVMDLQIIAVQNTEPVKTG